MTTTTKFAGSMLMATAALLAGCQKKTEVAPAAPVAAPAASEPAAAAPAASAPAPAPAAAAEPQSGAGSFDVNSVPVTTAALPPFPYLDWPEKLAVDDRKEKDEQEFDATNVVVGTQVRSIEGRVQQRHYDLEDAKLSPLAAERNYDAIMKGLGAVQVNKMQPGDPEFEKAYPDISVLKSFKTTSSYGKYKSYLIRTATGNIWIAITIDDDEVNVVAIEEKAMTQSIKPLSAAQLQSELAAKGHVALYMNFDTDKAIILDRDQGTVDEVGRLLIANKALKLQVEGHTDSSGDAARNQVLSEERARAVVASLVGKGIDRTRLAALGMGGSKPVADNGSEEGRARNRRVELVKQG